MEYPCMLPLIDLVNWSPVVNANGELKELISPRSGYFDSDLTMECGPPAIRTSKGIILFYNGKTSARYRARYLF